MLDLASRGHLGNDDVSILVEVSKPMSRVGHVEARVAGCIVCGWCFHVTELGVPKLITTSVLLAHLTDPLSILRRPTLPTPGRNQVSDAPDNGPRRDNGGACAGEGGIVQELCLHGGAEWAL